MSFKLNVDLTTIRDRAARFGKSPASLARIGLGVLIAANLVAAAIAFKPWMGSAEDIEAQVVQLRHQIQQKQAAVERTRTIVNKVQSARKDGDLFMARYLMSNRTVSSVLLAELEDTSRKAGIKQREITFSFEPLEGSETLTKAVITATYEGNYTDLVRFINELDRSPRFLILDSLGAAPQQGSQGLGITLRMTAFVREGGPDTPETPRSEENNGQPAMTSVAAAPPVAPHAAPVQQRPPQAGAPPFLPRGPMSAPPSRGNFAPAPPMRPPFGRRPPQVQQ